jgi:hypothetical protein
MIMSLSKYKTAKAIWSCLKGRYVQDSGALLHALMQQTHVIEQQDMSVDEYYLAFGRLMGSLTSMVPVCTAADCPAHKFIKKFFTYCFLMGVRAEFDSICTRLLHDSSTLTMTKALSDLFAKETCLWSLTSSMHVSHSVLAASQKFSTPKGASLEPCLHCGKTGHTPDNCFLHHPEKLAEFRARCATRTTRGRAIVSTPRGSVLVAAAAAGGSSSSS